jgi:hypothetical protein
MENRLKPTSPRRRRRAPRWWPALADLSPVERVLLRAARRLEAARAAPQLALADTVLEPERFRDEILRSVGYGFAASLGLRDGVAAASELENILCTFCCAGYRALDLRPICEPVVAPDERFLLAFLAACQRPDLYNVRSILSWLAPAAGAILLTAHGHAFGHRLHSQGITLPQRLRLTAAVGNSAALPCRHEHACRRH